VADTAPPARGRFVVLEGGEGSGKSTQVGRLVEFLRGTGVDVVRTREPGGTEGAERIRGLLVTGETSRWDGLTEVLLLAAARRDHLKRVILPALEAGIWVVSDRFVGSTRAYQGHGHGVALSAIDEIHRIACDGIEPDLTLVLDLPAEIGLARARERNGEAPVAAREGRFEALDTAFHQRLRDGFLDMAARSPERHAVVDATGAVDEVATLVTAAVARLRETAR
jgi:dTMP kinase